VAPGGEFGLKTVAEFAIKYCQFLDASGNLAVAAPPAAEPHQGLTLALGPSSASHVELDPSGSATAFRLDGHNWRLERDGSGAIASFKRDGAAVALTMLPTARVAATEGSSWSGAGLVFARPELCR